MLRLSGRVYLKTFFIFYPTRHLPIHHSLLIITFSLSLHLSFTPNLRLISSTNHSIISLLASLQSRFSGSLNLALFSFHITIIITVSLISSHFICYTAYYCSIVSENKPSLFIGWFLQELLISSLIFSNIILYHPIF